MIDKVIESSAVLATDNINHILSSLCLLFQDCVMLVKNESASTSNNTSSRSSCDKLVCDNRRGSLTAAAATNSNSSSNQSLSAFVVPFAGHRLQNFAESSASLASVSHEYGRIQRADSNDSTDSYRPQNKRRRLDSIISELNHCSTGTAAAAARTATTNGQGGQVVYRRRASLLNDQCLAECCANQVGDISSTTTNNINSSSSSGDRHARHFSSLISRPIAVQLAAAAAAASSQSSQRKGEHLADYRSLVGQFTQSLQWQDVESYRSQYSGEKSDNLAINLSCYDRQRENSNNCIRASVASKQLSQVGPRRARRISISLIHSLSFCSSLIAASSTHVDHPMHTKASNL